MALAMVAILLPAGHLCAAQADATNEPAAVLANILSASCSEDSKRFAGYLTARNANAFAAMTPAAQATLLKRFVLLDQPGEAHSEKDSSGDLLVVCVAPSATMQLHISNSEFRDNVAYLGLVVTDAADTAGANARRVTMGLVRENGQWKLLSLGLLLLDLPTLAEEWDRGEIQNNEKSAIASIQELSAAIEKYRATYTRLPQALAELGPPPKGAEPKGDHAGLLPPDLAAGHKDGYTFRYVIVGANDVGAPAVYEIAALPTTYGRTGTHSFLRDSKGTIHAADHQGAVGTLKDPALE